MTAKSFYIQILCLISALIMASGCADKTSVVWIEGETDPQTGNAVHVLKVINAPEGTDWSLWLTSNHISSGVVEGFALEHDGKVTALKAEYEFLPSESIPDFPYNQVDVEVWDMIPSLKEVIPANGGTTVVDQMPQVKIVDAPKAGWYRIVLDGACKIEAADEDGAWYAKVTLDNLKRNAGGNEIPNMIIEDWPDMGYRGFMLDISRNFTTKDNILKFIDLLAHYKVNIFHLHFGDDEGWRVEIAEFPELTSYGAHHSFPYRNEAGEYVETDYLMPSYNGSIDPDDMSSSANGFLTKEDYIEILKYAWERRISVIPEFDTPGHSRAAHQAYLGQG